LWCPQSTFVARRAPSATGQAGPDRRSRQEAGIDDRPVFLVQRIGGGEPECFVAFVVFVPHPAFDRDRCVGGQECPGHPDAYRRSVPLSSFNLAAFPEDVTGTHTASHALMGEERLATGTSRTGLLWVDCGGPRRRYHGLYASDIDLLRDCQSIVDLDPEIADRAFQLGMPEQKLDRAKIPGTPIDQRNLRPA
jgi:hypothetical protein